MPAVTKRRQNTASPARPLLAVAVATGLLVVVTFQIALTLGAPFGAAAMGGSNPGRLPDALRLVTGAAALMWLLAAFVVLARGGRALVPVPEAAARVGTWILVALLGLGSVMNFASSSPWERWGWGPFTLVMCAGCLALARSAAPGPSTPPVT